MRGPTFVGRLPGRPLRAAVALACAALAGLLARPAAAAPAPLPPLESALFHAPADEAPPDPPLEKHFPRTNEWRLDLLFPALAGRGGGYVGVGSDQNYTIAAAAGSEYLWLIDHDPIVRDLHQVYGPLIIASDDPDAFIKRFERNGRNESVRLLTAAYPEAGQQARLLRVFRDYAAEQRIYFRKQQARRVEGKPVTWLGDPDMYQWVRALFLGSRVHAVAGDLGGPTALRQIAEAARNLKVPVRVFYVSNAEDLFPIDRQVRENYAALPHDEKALLVRTEISFLPRAAGSVWHYQTQALADYLAKVARPDDYPGHNRMIHDLRGPAGQRFIDERGYSHISSDLPRWSPPKRRRGGAPTSASPAPDDRSRAKDRAAVEPGTAGTATD
jgi:hypothetical protein